MPRGDQLGRQRRLIQLLARPQGLALADAARHKPFDRPRDFDAGAYLRDAWDIVRGDLIAVRAVFSAGTAPHFSGRLWHPS